MVFTISTFPLEKFSKSESEEVSTGSCVQRGSLGNCSVERKPQTLTGNLPINHHLQLLLGLKDRIGD